MKKSILPVLLALFCFCGCLQEVAVEAPTEIPPETQTQEEIQEESNEIKTQILDLNWPQACNYTMDMSIEVPENWSMLSRVSIWDEQERYTCGSNGVQTVLREGQALSDLLDLDRNSSLLSSEIIIIDGKEYLLEINDVWAEYDKNANPHEAFGDNIYYNYYFLQEDHMIHFFFVHYENSEERLALYEQILSSMQVEISNSYAKYDPLVNALDYPGILEYEFEEGGIPELEKWNWYYIFDALSDSRPSIIQDDNRYYPAEEVETVLCTTLSVEPSVIRDSTGSYDAELNAYMEPTGLGGVGPVGVITSAEENGAVIVLTIDLYGPDDTEACQTSVLTVEQTESGWKYLSNKIID